MEDRLCHLNYINLCPLLNGERTDPPVWKEQATHYSSIFRKHVWKVYNARNWKQKHTSSIHDWIEATMITSRGDNWDAKETWPWRMKKCVQVQTGVRRIWSAQSAENPTKWRGRPRGRKGLHASSSNKQTNNLKLKWKSIIGNLFKIKIKTHYEIMGNIFYLK